MTAYLLTLTTRTDTSWPEYMAQRIRAAVAQLTPAQRTEARLFARHNLDDLAGIEAHVRRMLEGESVTESEPYQNAADAIAAVDRLADDGHRPEMAAALTLERHSLIEMYRWSCEQERIRAEG